MVPRHELELLALVLMALPRKLIAALQLASKSRQPEEEEPRLWAAVSSAKASDQLNIDVAMELEILAGAFNAGL